MKVHNVKLMEKYFDRVEKRMKNFEVRYNDRNYNSGDWLVLEEWNGEEYTGRWCVRQIKYVVDLGEIGLNGWVAMEIW